VDHGIDGGVGLLAMMLRCTTKALALITGSASGGGHLTDAESDDEDWYLNLIYLDRRKCLLVVHAGTMFPVLTVDVRKADLTPIGPWVTALIQRELEVTGLPPDTFGHLDPAEVRLGRTANRRMVSFMNQMAWTCRWIVARDGGLAQCDTDDLNRWLKKELHSRRELGPSAYLTAMDLVAQRLTGALPAEAIRGLQRVE
jgi:hypothetical protein